LRATFSTADKRGEGRGGVRKQTLKAVDQPSLNRRPRFRIKRPSRFGVEATLHPPDRARAANLTAVFKIRIGRAGV
jgi:hypothetical protein